MRILRKTLVASAVALAMAGPAQAAIVLFDVNGGGDGPGNDQIKITTFDWQPGNLLLKDITPIAVATVSPATPIYSQGLLGTLAGPGVLFSYNGTFPGQLTYQLTLNVNYTAGGAGQTVLNPTAIPGTFDIFYHSAAIANDVSGCGFGDSLSGGAVNVVATTAHCGVFPGTRIYTGSALLTASATLTDTGPIAPPDSNSLDQFGTVGSASDTDEGIITNSLGLGTLRLNIDTLSADTTFFLSDISSLPTDIRHTEQGGGAPFEQANPSDEVVGNQISRPTGDGTGAAFRIATYGSDLINNTGAGSCGAASLNPCDVHLQSDASSTVLTSIPEPQSLALLGLGLGLLGASLRRRVKRFVA